LKLFHLGLVTELYHGTLKDLLENPRKPDYKETGYGILRDLQFKDRIRAILPFIYNIADGLSIMHEAGYVHLDLKPANIFWRRVGKDRFEAAIGDLGYIRSADNDPPVTRDAYAALGTLHYRSPEQKDFKDSCEVDIWPSEDPEKIKLTTNDPKFMGTIVEPGDTLIFQSDLDRNFRIETMPPKNGETDRRGDSVTQICVKSLDKNRLNPDQRTQAVIYKNQGLRTDLFGFGAIVYDLLTCGRSPERFYNNLIVDDGLRTSVTSIMDNYGHIETRSRRDPKYAHIFEPFFDVRKNKYAPKEAVALILKCMLYRAKGTYFDTNKTNPFEDVLADVRKLYNKHGGLDSIKSNPLVSSVWKKYAETTPLPPNELREEISAQQDLPTDKTTSTFAIRRVAWAAIRLTQLIRLVRQTLRLSMEDPDKDDRKFYFLELAPENISILDEKLEVGERGYVHRKEFIAEMLEDVVHTRTILYDSQDPYSSFEHMGDIRRRVKLMPTGAPPTWRYRFLDSSRIGDSVKKDDWIIVPGKCVAVIGAIDDDRLTLKPVLEKKGDEYPGFEKELEADETFFLRNLDPLGYCVSMLGTYVYQLLFVGLSGNSVSEPESVQSLRAQLKASPSRTKNIRELLRNALYQPAYQDGASCARNWSDLYRRFTTLYLALSLPDTRTVFIHDNLPEETNLLGELIRTWEDSICRDIARILGLRQESFFSDPTNLTDLSAKLGLSDDHSDEAGQKMAAGIVSAANLVVHVRNILLAAHSSVESAAAAHA
jgi:serine/threonine protein kinase